MTLQQANEILAADRIDLRIEKNDRSRPRWRIQIRGGALVFATLLEALRMATALHTTRPVPERPYWMAAHT